MGAYVCCGSKGDEFERGEDGASHGRKPQSHETPVRPNRPPSSQQDSPEPTDTVAPSPQPVSTEVSVPNNRPARDDATPSEDAASPEPTNTVSPSPQPVLRDVPAQSEGDDKDSAVRVLQRKFRSGRENKRKRIAAYRGSLTLTVEELREDASPGAGCAQEVMKVEILSAANLRDVTTRVFKGKNSKSSPYVVCDYGDVNFQTQAIKSDLNPTWNESVDVVDHVKGLPIAFAVYHKGVDEGIQICLGRAMLQPATFEEDGFDGELELKETGKKLGTSQLKVRITFGTKESANAASKKKVIQKWITCSRPIGLRRGPGEKEARQHVDLRPGEEFDVTEIVQGPKDQKYLRLADGRGWAFTRSTRDNTVLAEPLNFWMEDEKPARKGKRLSTLVYEAMSARENQLPLAQGSSADPESAQAPAQAVSVLKAESAMSDAKSAEASPEPEQARVPAVVPVPEAGATTEAGTLSEAAPASTQAPVTAVVPAPKAETTATNATPSEAAPGSDVTSGANGGATSNHGRRRNRVPLHEGRQGAKVS
eukprot:TRINITY_DN34340_c0_g1_i1.p1 TRINITY_DN34340_c0_g1~~TRINITY_DN34340_c0_g1_i1.p1  ORF type:complete len:537 (+),score=90.79 TRINITY_DN34340_c0_g1_i1:271-1881(+)